MPIEVCQKCRQYACICDVIAYHTDDACLYRIAATCTTPIECEHGSIAVQSAIHVPAEQNMSMFGPKLGTWWVKCPSDPRWDNSGPPELQKWIKECRERFGDPPKDAEMGFMKD